MAQAKGGKTAPNSFKPAASEEELHNNVPLDYLYSEALETAHEELRALFEPLIEATKSLPEVQVLAALTLRIHRLMRITKLLCDQGYAEESNLPARSATEAVANLLYITCVGPKLNEGTSASLAKQFLDYREIAYGKDLDVRKDDIHRMVQDNLGSVPEHKVDEFIEERKTRKKELINAAGLNNGSHWTHLTIRDVSQRVLKNLPSYVEGHMAETAFASSLTGNSAVHGDALSLATQYRALGNKPLQVKLSSENITHHIVAYENVWAWKAMATYFYKVDEFTTIWNKYLKSIYSRQLEKHLRDGGSETTGLG